MVWESIKKNLQNDLPDNVYDLWIAPMVSGHCDETTLQLACPDRFFSSWIEAHYLALIQEKLDELDSGTRKVVLCENVQQVLPAPKRGKQLRLPNMPAVRPSMPSLHPRYTFDQFMVGESNIMAQSACKSMASGEDSVGQCIYISSGTGLGKSHLTQAVAHHVISSSSLTRMHFVTARQFSSEMIQGIKNNSMDLFKNKYHNQCDMLLVEDVHTLTGKAKTQEELNELLDRLIKSGKKVILTANSNARDLVGIDDEFRSRMTSGLVTTIQEPDLRTRTRIVADKATTAGLSLSEEQISWIAGHIHGDIRQIESALIGIKAKSELCGGLVDQDIIQQVVESIVDLPGILTVQTITEFVGQQYKVPLRDLCSRSRKKSVTLPRQVAMYLSRKHTRDSLADIGKVFKRDHSTVLHSIRKITDLIVRDTSINGQITLLSKKVEKM